MSLDLRREQSAVARQTASERASEQERKQASKQEQFEFADVISVKSSVRFAAAKTWQHLSWVSRLLWLINQTFAHSLVSQVTIAITMTTANY